MAVGDVVSVHTVIGQLSVCFAQEVFSCTYDAWNRLVEVKEVSTVIQTNEYDGLNRRTIRVEGGETRHFYYNQQWQVLEERVGTVGQTARVDAQYVYHPHYVDAIAMRYWDSDSTGGTDTAHYYLHPSMDQREI